MKIDSLSRIGHLAASQHVRSNIWKNQQVAHFPAMRLLFGHSQAALDALDTEIKNESTPSHDLIRQIDAHCDDTDESIFTGDPIIDLKLVALASAPGVDTSLMLTILYLEMKDLFLGSEHCPSPPYSPEQLVNMTAEAVKDTMLYCDDFDRKWFLSEMIPGHEAKPYADRLKVIIENLQDDVAKTMLTTLIFDAAPLNGFYQEYFRVIGFDPHRFDDLELDI